MSDEKMGDERLHWEGGSLLGRHSRCLAFFSLSLSLLFISRRPGIVGRLDTFSFPSHVALFLFTFCFGGFP